MDTRALFEQEMLSLNPGHDLIFGAPQPPKPKSPPHPLEYEEHGALPGNLKIISTMNNLIGNRPVGELPSISQWDNTDNAEEETIALMRRLGLEPSVDRQPCESRTISTYPINDDVIYMRNGRRSMPIFMGDTYFKLRPRSMNVSYDTDDYSTIIRPPRQETVVKTSTSSEATNTGMEYRPLDSINTSTSVDLSMSDESFPPLEEPRIRKNPKEKRKPKETTQTNWRNHSPPSAASWPKSKNSQRHVNSEGSWRRQSTELADRPSTANSWRRPAESAIELPKHETTKKPQRKSKGNNQSMEKQQRSQGTGQPVAISTCGSRLYKPKDLFLKKKAILVKKVFEDHQDS